MLRDIEPAGNYRDQSYKSCGWTCVSPSFLRSRGACGNGSVVGNMGRLSLTRRPDNGILTVTIRSCSDVQVFNMKKSIFVYDFLIR